MRELATLCLLLTSLFDGGMSGGAGATGTYGQQMQMPVVNIAAPSGGSTPTIVQSCHNADATSGPTIVCTMGSTIIAGHALVACAQWNNNDTPTMTVNGGTAASIFDDAWDFETQCYMIASATGGSTTVTATYGATARQRIIMVAEISGLSASPVDQVDMTVFTNGTAMSTASITPTQSGELILAMFNASNNGPTMTTTAPFATVTSDFTTNPLMLSSQLQTTATAVSASGTLSAASDYIAVIFSLKHA